MFHRLRESLSSHNLAVIIVLAFSVDYVHSLGVLLYRGRAGLSHHLNPSILSLLSLYMVPPFGPSAMLSRLRIFGSMSSLCGVILARVRNQSGTIVFSLSPADECFSPSLMASISGAFSRRFLSSGDEM